MALLWVVVTAVVLPFSSGRDDLAVALIQGFGFFVGFMGTNTIVSSAVRSAEAEPDGNPRSREHHDS